LRRQREGWRRQQVLMRRHSGARRGIKAPFVAYRAVEEESCRLYATTDASEKRRRASERNLTDSMRPQPSRMRQSSVLGRQRTGFARVRIVRV
jgi:hypothetical protein